MREAVARADSLKRDISSARADPDLPCREMLRQLIEQSADWDRAREAIVAWSIELDAETMDLRADLAEARLTH